jgi:hypothetical protein
MAGVRMSNFVGRSLLAVLLLLVGSMKADAIVLGESNLPLLGYPEARCYELRVPYSDDDYAWESFRHDADEYVDCINQYIEAGNNDIRRIREAQQDALNEANAFIRRIDR